MRTLVVVACVVFASFFDPGDPMQTLPPKYLFWMAAALLVVVSAVRKCAASRGGTR